MRIYEKILIVTFIVTLSFTMYTTHVYGDWVGITDGNTRMGLETDGSIPVTLQDQTTPILIAPLHHLEATTTITVDTAIDDYTITLTSTTGFTDDRFIIMSCATHDEIWYARQVGAPVGNVITVDRPLDFAFLATDAVITANETNMNVNGSVTPVIFSLRQGTTGVSITADVTRIMFLMITTSAVDLLKFGNITELTKGITIRYVNSTYHNIVTVKTNGELAGVAYDMGMYAATNPNQGIDGLHARLTFGGQNKMGVVIRVDENSDLQCIINDDLTALTRFVIIAEGSVAITD